MMKYVFPALAVVLMVSGPLRAADKPSYLKDVKPFLAQYCTGCHNGTKAKSGYDLDDYDSLFKGGRKGPAVVAGKPDKSMLIRTLEGTAKRMPPRKYSEQPSAKEIARVKAWVSAGAKDDSSASKEKADNMPAEKSDKGSVSFESDFCRARRD